MNAPSTIEALVLIALALAPGYVFTRTITRVISQVEEPPDLRFLVTTITWGLLIHAILLLLPRWWWPNQIPKSSEILDFYFNKSLPNHAEDVGLWALVAIAFIPWLLGWATAQVLARTWFDAEIMDKFEFSIVKRTPTAWQYVTNKERSAFVVVYLKDGRSVGGCYSSKSFTSNNPRHGDIYLESRCRLNDENEFQYGVAYSEGVWIAHDVISHVEFLSKDFEFPASDADSTVANSAASSDTRASLESSTSSKAGPERRTRASAKRLIEAAAAAAFVQAIWRMMSRLNRT